MWPYLITAKLMRPSNMKRFPTPGVDPQGISFVNEVQVISSRIYTFFTNCSRRKRNLLQGTESSAPVNDKQ